MKVQKVRFSAARRYTLTMPTKSKLKLKPVDTGKESLGQRLSRLRNCDRARQWVNLKGIQREGCSLHSLRKKSLGW